MSSTDVSPLVWPSGPSPWLSAAFLGTFFGATGVGGPGLRITFAGTGSDGAELGSSTGSSAGAARRTGALLAGFLSLFRYVPHLWQTVAVTELRVLQTGHGFDPIFRISSSSRSQSSNVTNVGCFRHQSWNSRSVRARPRVRWDSSRNLATTSSYCIRIFSW